MGNKNTQLTNLAVNTEADAFGALLNAGFIDLYTTAQPATGDTALGAQTRLASPVFGNPAFAASVAGVITANAITADANAAATGKATWARLRKTDHTTAVLDLSVGMKLVGADFTFTSGTKTIARAAGGFNATNLAIGDQLTVAGSASNNGTFTVATIVGDGSITVNEAIVTEAAGASVTLSEVKNIVVNNVNIQVGAQVSVSSLTHTVAKATSGS